MINDYGLDASYFAKNLSHILAGIDRYTPAEMARALTRLAVVASTADARSVIEREAAPQPATVAVDAVALAELRAALVDLDDPQGPTVAGELEGYVIAAARRLLAGGEA